MQKLSSAAIMAAVLCACNAEPSAQLPGNSRDDQPFAGIGQDELINLTGTEPFWGGRIAGSTFTYTVPELPDGQAITVRRFAGRGGLSFSGELAGQSLDIAVTPAVCSDGMSDRTYPFTVTLQIGDDQRIGCGWSDKQPMETPPGGE